MADASGRDFTTFMRWYAQAGTPELTVARRYDAEAKTYTLEITQKTPPTPGQVDKKPLHLPVAMGLIGKTSGRALPLRLEGENRPVGTSRVLELEAEARTFTFADIDEEPVPSLLRDFSAPVRLHHDLSRDELSLLFARD